LVSPLAACAEQKEAEMARLSGRAIGKSVRDLAMALALGGAIVSLVPLQTAHAARSVPTEAGGADAGGGDAETGSGSGTERKRDIGARCYWVDDAGVSHFEVPGTRKTIRGITMICGANGEWKSANTGTSPSGPRFPGGSGVVTSAP
jgi:hypothetical protein